MTIHNFNVTPNTPLILSGIVARTQINGRPQAQTTFEVSGTGPVDDHARFQLGHQAIIVDDPSGGVGNFVSFSKPQARRTTEVAQSSYPRRRGGRKADGENRSFLSGIARKFGIDITNISDWFITGTVEAGIPLVARNCRNLSVSAVGAIDVEMKSMAELAISGFDGGRFVSTGGDAKLIHGSGHLELEISGFSNVQLAGDFESVRLRMDGGTLTTYGRIGRLSGSADGMCEVNLNGDVIGGLQKRGIHANLTINGQDMAPTQGWTF